MHVYWRRSHEAPMRLRSGMLAALAGAALALPAAAKEGREVDVSGDMEGCREHHQPRRRACPHDVQHHAPAFARAMTMRDHKRDPHQCAACSTRVNVTYFDDRALLPSR